MKTSIGVKAYLVGGPDSGSTIMCESKPPEIIKTAGILALSSLILNDKDLNKVTIYTYRLTIKGPAMENSYVYIYEGMTIGEYTGN